MSIETLMEPLVSSIRDGGDWLVKAAAAVDAHVAALGAHINATEEKTASALAPLVDEVKGFAASAESLVAKMEAATASLTAHTPSPAPVAPEAAPVEPDAPAIDPNTGMPHAAP